MSEGADSGVRTVASDDAPSGPGREAAAELPRGATIGRYVIVGKLGVGGMGVVYTAYDPELDRKVALKLLLPTQGDLTLARARLQREAQAMAKVSDPHVVNVHDVGVVDDRLFVAMELVAGQTVTRWLAERPRSWREVLDAFVQVGRGLAAAHRVGLLHRDVKPDNMMVDGQGRARVMDFGLARTREPTGDVDTGEISGRTPSSGAASGPGAVTKAGSLVGTPAYMAPEQFQRGELDGRTDQFGYCVALWEALYGERPFQGDGLAALVMAVTQGERRTPPRGHAVPAWLGRAVRRGLAVAPEDRWPTMDALLAELSRDRGRRRIVGVVGASAVLATAAATAWLGGPPSEPCTTAVEELAAVYDDDVRARLGAAIHDTNVAYADDVWARVAPRLDGWAQQWTTSHTEACEATRVHGTQSDAVLDLRMACLARARDELGATVGVLQEATPSMVEHLHEIVEGLPRLDGCADVDALRADPAAPTADEKDAVAVARAEMTRARTRFEAGELDEAGAALRRAERSVEGVGYAPVHTELELARGKLDAVAGRYPQAERRLRDVLRRASADGQWPLVRDASISLMMLLTERLSRHAEALAMREVVEGLSQGLPVALAELHVVVGHARIGEGDGVEAETEFRKALELFAEAIGPDSPEVAAIRHNLGAALRLQGKPKEALAEFRAARQTFETALGPSHPSVAEARLGLAAALSAAGEHEASEAEYREGLQQQIRALGPDHPEIATSRNSLASVLYLRHEYDEAETECRAALAHAQRVLEPKDPAIARCRNTLAAILLAQGHLPEAEDEFRTVLALRREAFGDDHIDVATVRNNLATVLRMRGDDEGAAAEFQTVITTLQATVGADHPQTATAHANYARVLYAQDEYARAEAEDRKGLEIREKRLGESHPLVAKSLRGLGQDLLALGRATESAEALRRAWTIDEVTDAAPHDKGQTAFELARALWTDPSARDEAIEWAERARAAYTAAGATKAEDLAKVEAWLAAHG